jgi:hypothetical protein
LQIFLPDKDFNKCAEYLDDKRLNKIIVEAAQILSTALWVNNCDIAETMYAEGKIYLPSHEFHPLVKWAASHNLNFMQVNGYLISLVDEYYYRFNKIHKCSDMYYTFCILQKHIKNTGDYCRQPNCTTHHKHIKDIFLAYREELCYKWNNDKVKPKWTHRDIPWFYKE